MDFDWKEYFKIAKYLSWAEEEGISKEAFFRTAVSRAYYSVFCSARNLAVEKLNYKKEKKAEDHRKLRKFLSDRGHRALSSLINELRVWRNLCDYEDKVENIDRCYQSSLKYAEQAFKIINQISAVR